MSVDIDTDSTDDLIPTEKGDCTECDAEDVVVGCLGSERICGDCALLTVKSIEAVEADEEAGEEVGDDDE